ncbi:predicted protein [Plenodomus lingam JN3]|uniref:Predicted protein n=1 Tax=Leptosphaeria maculans (strain JN3 / isolate v23.1.3 / race Av1-4-5-6-7-8) TaxID=985895 RepID=E5A4D0_LEPMJ|nr:predicted protein [Plenodomus lingam JN3]CBX98475.1 predicted protein [Plenodomus lingam JN3]
MKLILLALLPVAVAQEFYTNDGWSKPDDDRLNSACKNNQGWGYVCGYYATSSHQNAFPDAFPIPRWGCHNADKFMKGVCTWKKASGMILCCPP